MDMKLNEQDRDVLTHTLTGSSRDGKVYRNYFAARPDEPSLNRLCDAGFMRRGRKFDDCQYFHCTEAGAAAVGLRLPQDA
jgi:hypothetical protein